MRRAITLLIMVGLSALTACIFSSTSHGTPADAGTDTGVDGGTMTVDLSPTTGVQGNDPVSTVAYLVTFSSATTIVGLEFKAQSADVQTTWVTDVWDLALPFRLANGSTVAGLGNSTDWYHSNISFAAEASKQYVVAVHRASGNALYSRSFNVTLPYTVGNVTVLKWCSASGTTDDKPTCDNTAFGFPIRIVEQ